MVKLAYGHCHLSMKPGGRGELTVPTVTSYGVAVQVFGREDVTVTNEYGTTKYSFEGNGHGEPAVKLPVYRAPGEHGSRGEATTDPHGKELRGLRYCPVTRSLQSCDGQQPRL